tara:strand:+ start:162 stop:920 length:759 start_codon:yes stop_codon:yes gene_type:complete
MFDIFRVSSEYNNSRLDNLLVNLKIVSSRNKASALIMAGYVYLDEKEISKSGSIIKAGSILKVRKRKTWVSRGGLKLDNVLKRINLKVENFDCLDLGCSTGGFSEVLLSQGASSVLGVDVGYGQIDLKVRNNKKFSILERTNVRFLKLECKQQFDIIVADLSFISLKKAIPPSLIYLKKNGILLTLIKPQFEANRESITKGGIVKDLVIHEKVCNDVITFFRVNQKLSYLSLIESSILGQKGNKEFFGIFRK